jgi:hypothetical protein
MAAATSVKFATTWDRFPVSLPGVAPPTTLKPSPCKQRREPQSSGAGCGGPRSERRAG